MVLEADGRFALDGRGGIFSFFPQFDEDKLRFGALEIEGNYAHSVQPMLDMISVDDNARVVE